MPPSLQDATPSTPTETTEVKNDVQQTPVDSTSATAKEVIETPTPTQKGVEDTTTATPEFNAKDYYNPTGVATIDSILSELQTAKIPAAKSNAIFEPVLSSMDISKLDMVALEKAVGKDKASTIRDRAELFLIKEKATREDFTKEINTLTDNNWDSIKDWAKSKFSEEDRSHLNTLLLSGGLSRQIAASFLSMQYKDATALTPVKESTSQIAERVLVKPTAATLDSTMLSADAYKAERAKLPRLGGILTKEGERLSELLDAKRLAAIKLERGG